MVTEKDDSYSGSIIRVSIIWVGAEALYVVSDVTVTTQHFLGKKGYIRLKADRLNHFGKTLVMEPDYLSVCQNQNLLC